MHRSPRTRRGGCTASDRLRSCRGPGAGGGGGVVGGRRVPPAGPGRPAWGAGAALGGVCAEAWPAVVERPLGAWRLRAADGYTRLANSALATGDPGMAYPAALGL